MSLPSPAVPSKPSLSNLAVVHNKMHCTLQIPEIVAHIFNFIAPALLHTSLNAHTCHRAATDLVALARTCRAFKEPALDVLWRNLVNLSPLIRCLPVAFRRARERYNMPEYSLVKPLGQAEWDVFRSYARRIRHVLSFHSQLDCGSIVAILNPPSTSPLLPNLRSLCSRYADPSISLLRLPFPSLVHLDVTFRDQCVAQDAIESFSKYSPKIAQLRISFAAGDTRPQKINPEYICCWQNLQSVICPNIALDVDALVHLSRLPTLTTLNFVLSTVPPTPDPHSVVFPNLHVLGLTSGESLDPISQLLFQTTQPSVLKFFTGIILRCPSRQELLSFFAAFHVRDSCPTVEILGLDQLEWDPSRPETTHDSEAVVLDSEILNPCVAFRHLRCLNLDIQCNVALTNSQILMLASEWPKLEQLSINVSWGWNSAGGITPCGLLQLLKLCRSLRGISLRFDTQGYTEVPTSCSLENLHFELEAIYVLDSALEAHSVDAISKFFCRLVTSSKSGLTLCNWSEGHIRDFPEMEEHERRWDLVSDQVEDAVTRCFGSQAPDFEPESLEQLDDNKRMLIA